MHIRSMAHSDAIRSSRAHAQLTVAGALSAQGHASRLSALASAAFRVLMAVLIASMFNICISAEIDKAYATRPLNIYVGYAGGPYYTKASFTEAQLESLADPNIYTYSSLDAGNFVHKYRAWGIPLDKLWSYSADSYSGTGVNSAALWRIFFATESEEDRYNKLGFDGYGTDGWYWGRYGEYESDRSLDITKVSRYFYPTLADNYDFNSNSFGYDENGSREPVIAQSSVAVPSMLALKYTGEKINTRDGWDSIDTSPLGDTNNRLMFGQRTPSDIGLMYTTYDVAGIYCVYTGRPEVKVTLSSDKASIGETIRATATLSTADPFLSKEGLKDIEWSSEYPNVATVTSNGDGTANVQIIGKGDVKIIARFGDSEYDEFLTEDSALVSGPGGSNWRGEGEGTGYDYGDGDGEQPGIGGGLANGEGEDDGDSDNGDASDGDSGDADENQNVGNDESNANANDTQINLAPEDRPQYTRVPDNAVRVTAAASPIKELASSTAGDAGSGGQQGGDESDQTEEQQLRAYRLNVEEQPPVEEEADPPPIALPDIPWPVVCGTILLILAGGAIQIFAYRHSLDPIVSRKDKRLIWNLWTQPSAV